MKHKRNLPIIKQDNDPIATQERDSREDRFITNLFLGLSVQDAALGAGYSASYSSGPVYVKFNSLPFQTKLRDYAIAHNAVSVPKVVDLYKRTVDQLHKEVCSGSLDNLAKLKHIPTQMLQIGKILATEAPQAVINLVNIESLQAIIQNKLGDKGDK